MLIFGKAFPIIYGKFETTSIITQDSPDFSDFLFHFPEKSENHNLLPKNGHQGILNVIPQGMKVYLVNGLLDQVKE